jgi:beta-galactosidase
MAIDGNPATTWHTLWDEPKPDFPHELVIELSDARALRGLNCLPRQDGNPNGWIKEYAVFVSSDGQTWGEPVAKGVFARDARLKDVWFVSPVSARFVKLVALSGHANGPWASVAEIELLPAGN